VWSHGRKSLKFSWFPLVSTDVLRDLTGIGVDISCSSRCSGFVLKRVNPYKACGNYVYHLL
jgi:hypothetical protein